ncbi:hypothetical protein KDD17_09800 [Sulfitobacter albidus]|uniref:Uncharacterized protein n=1 Tax=Sulfitobacter albidus TaxID=2829501 RepID=A0A975JB93_9RHOB|nr:hypothetical protein [Sulfitobacter albidus]QUJ75294.1 hypothetical protein KDD17_09800 [Sulfitobacter albidus]
MKPILATFTGLILATGVALTASAAQAGTTATTYTQNGVTWTDNAAVPLFGSNTRDRAWGAQYENHFGSPFHGNYGAQGTYTKELYDQINANNHGSKRAHRN